MSSRVGWIAGAMVLGAIGLVALMRPAPPADSPATSPARSVPVAVPEEPRRTVEVAEEVAAPEPLSRKAPPLPPPAAVPSEVVQAYRESARSMPSDSPGIVATFVAANEASLSAPDVFAEFTAEAIDADWAPGAQTDILSKLAEQPGLQVLALQVECRTTMCQVRLTQPSSASGEPPVRILNSLGMQLRFIMALKSQPSMHTSVAYLMRPGHAVPPPERRQRAEQPPADAKPARQ